VLETESKGFADRGLSWQGICRGAEVEMKTDFLFRSGLGYENEG
jgi:hypothetical protein